MYHWRPHGNARAKDPAREARGPRPPGRKRAFGLLPVDQRWARRVDLRNDLRGRNAIRRQQRRWSHGGRRGLLQEDFRLTDIERRENDHGTDHGRDHDDLPEDAVQVWAHGEGPPGNGEGAPAPTRPDSLLRLLSEESVPEGDVVPGGFVVQALRAT